MDVYDLYKPLRNYMRGFALLPSLEAVWLISQNLAGYVELPLDRFRTEFGLPVSLKNKIFPWELETLSREVILNAGLEGCRDLASWNELAAAITRVRSLENEIYAQGGENHDVLRELHRTVHRQFPWQDPPNANSMTRYLKIFEGSGLDALVAERVGLGMRELYLLGLAVSGHLRKKFGIRTDTDYAVLGISSEKSSAFFNHLVIDLRTLRERTKRLQKYDQNWVYTFNPLRASPLVQFDTRHPERVVCPIPEFVLRRISEGIFYDVAGAEGFDNAFGRSFQQYVSEVAHKICGSRFRISDEQEYRVGRDRKDGVDLIVEDQTAAIFVECKTKRLRQEAKFFANEAGLLDDITVMAGYVVQHYKNILDARAGHTTWQLKDVPIFPLIVTLEDWWIFTPSLVNALSDRVSQLLADAALPTNLPEEMPYTVASIADFELALQVMDSVDIARFFDSKTDKATGPGRLGHSQLVTLRMRLSRQRVICFQMLCPGRRAPGDLQTCDLNLSPRTKPPVSSHHLIQLKGASRGVRVSGMRRRPAGWITQVLHSGGAGAPPGTTTSPCQELAEGSAGAFERDRPD